MGKALYRKYRSKSLGEIVGQEHITQTLDKALTGGRISHAYLFSGPRGVGKTSIARILAHEINGLPYADDSAHLDIIEIDAASNRRIDEIRDIREKVYMAPTAGKYKVYIIDEVHMLTREAFNALLKTLEEPPAHAVFILATTEAHKLPETIVSRTQHYTFKPVDQQKVVDHLAKIAKSEKISISGDAIKLIAAHGEGSFRDSISLLDQAGNSGGNITLDDVRRMLGIAPAEALDGLIASIQAHSDTGTVLKQIAELYGQGLQASSIARQLAGRLRSALADNQPLLPAPVTMHLLRSLIEVPASHNPERLLEILLIEAADAPGTPVTAMSAAVSASSVQEPRVKPQAMPTAVASPEPTSPVQAPPAAKVSEQPAAASGAPKQATQPDPKQSVPKVDTPVATDLVVETVQGPAVAAALNDSTWPEILNCLKKEYNTLYGVLRNAKPVYGADSIELQFKFAFHQKRLNEAKNRQIIANFIKQITGKDVSVVCSLYKPESASEPALVAVATPAALDSITDIFGGGEVMST